MTTNELINLLNKADPRGEGEVLIAIDNEDELGDETAILGVRFDDGKDGPLTLYGNIYEDPAHSAKLQKARDDDDS